MMTSNYIRSLNTISSDLNKLNTQVTSGRAFTKASENTSAAIRAFQVRRDLSKTEGYESNILHARSSLESSESSIYHIQELVQNAGAKVLQGMNGTQSESERKIIATELRNVQDQILQSLNATDSDSYYFGGSNTDTKPFEVVGGKLSYNGQSLDTLTAAAIKDLESDSRYVDIGLNVKFDALGVLDKNTVFNYSVPGIKIVGSGTTNDTAGNPMSNNLYDLIGQLASEFESSTYSGTKANELYGHLQTNSASVIHSLTEVGTKTSYLDFMTTRLENKTLNDQGRQLAIEGADPSATIIQFKSQEAAYNAALQMGAKIIQPSIFDYIS
jgi:flagellar hook-associated protein 3 FlgL